MKDFFILLLIIILFTFSWVKFFPQQYQPVIYEYAANKSNIQLTFFGFKWETENVLTIESLMTEFINDSKTVNILYESIKGREYFRALKKQMETNNGHDIFMVSQDMLPALARQGHLVELSDLPELKNYSEPALSQIRDAKGSVWALPTSISAFGLYCNLDLLKKHGVPLPDTLQDFLAACKKFSDAGITPIIANNDISLKTLVMARGMPAFYQSGENVSGLVNASKLPLSTYFRSGFALLKELCDHGYIDRQRTLVTRKTRDDLTDFARGESPFMLTGLWASARLREMANFRYTVVPYPVQEDGPILVINIDTRLALNAHGKHLPEAKSFLRYMIQAESINRFCANQTSFSPLKAFSTSNPLLQNLEKHLHNGRAIIGADSRFVFPIWEISRAASLKILEGASVEQACRGLDDAVAAAIQEQTL